MGEKIVFDEGKQRVKQQENVDIQRKLPLPMYIGKRGFMKFRHTYIGFVLKDFMFFMGLSWVSQRIFFNVINDDSTADAIVGMIVWIGIFCMTIYYFSHFLFFIL